MSIQPSIFFAKTSFSSYIKFMFASSDICSNFSFKNF